MTHPLESMVSGKNASLYQVPIRKQQAAVTVELKNGSLFIVPWSIRVVNEGTLFVPLPDKLKLLSPDGSDVAHPTHRFWISTETFNPFHLIIDWDGKK